MTTHAAETMKGQEEEYRVVALRDVYETTKNPRRHFDKQEMADLTASIAQKGQLTAGIGRPDAKGRIELAAGARRRRAIEALGLASMKVIVRPMSDQEFLDVIIIENGQRADIHPLEQAEGFKRLLTESRYDVPTIAERCGRSEQHVYDRLQLLKLVPIAQDLFLERRFELAHAVLLSRLPREVQAELVHIEDDGYAHGELWSRESVSDLFAADEHDQQRLKPISPRELESWINRHVRFSIDDETVPQLFPATVEAFAKAEAAAQKVIPITYSHQLHDDAKDGKVRTYGAQSWTRADGLEESVTCDRSVLGYVAAGPRRGEAFLICVDKKKCEVHYGAEIKEAKRKEKVRAQAAAGDEGAKAKVEKEDKSAALKAKKEEQAKAVRMRAAGPLLDAVKSTIAKLSDKALVAWAWARVRDGELWRHWDSPLAKQKTPPKNSTELLRTICLDGLLDNHENVSAGVERSFDALLDDAESIGVDTAKILKAAAKDPAAAKVPVKAPKQNKTASKNKTAVKSRPRTVFMAPMQPSPELAAIVGSAPLPKTEVIKKLWAHVKKHGLQNKKNKRLLNLDAPMQAVFGAKPVISMFDLAKGMTKHLSPATP